MKPRRHCILTYLLMVVFLLGGIAQLAQSCAPLSPGILGSPPSQGAHSHFDQPLQLEWHQTDQIQDTNITIQFVDIIEDSRCPSDVNYVWEGQATILLKLMENGQHLGELELTERAAHEDLATGKIEDYEDYIVTLINVSPYPQSTVILEPDDYCITL